MNFHSQSAEQRLTQLQYYQRFLTLCHYAAKETGQFAYPPFVDLVERWATLPSNVSRLNKDGTYPWGECGRSVHIRRRWRTVGDSFNSSYHNSTFQQAIIRLQQVNSSTHVNEIQQLILILAQETRRLEANVQLMDLTALDDEDVVSMVQEAVEVIRYVRIYLLAKYSTLHFLNPERMSQEQPKGFEAHRDRCFSYLTALQNAVYCLTGLMAGAWVGEVPRD
ncbi:MAG: hypothetical protein AAGA75_00500 [Cyanobacteria bacterium P01_E01_bin.6]